MHCRVTVLLFKLSQFWKKVCHLCDLVVDHNAAAVVSHAALDDALDEDATEVLWKMQQIHSLNQKLNWLQLFNWSLEQTNELLKCLWRLKPA